MQRMFDFYEIARQEGYDPSTLSLEVNMLPITPLTHFVGYRLTYQADQTCWIARDESNIHLSISTIFLYP